MALISSEPQLNGKYSLFTELSLDDSVISSGAKRVDTKLIHLLIHIACCLEKPPLLHI